MDKHKGEDRPYIGSVRFYKHFILTVIALCIVVPISISMVLYYKQTTLNDRYERQNALMLEQADRIRDLEVLARPVIEVEKRAAGAVGDASGVYGKLDWNLMVVNHQNDLPEDFTVNLKKVYDGQFVDERIVEPLEEMMSAAEKDGIHLYIYSSYRNVEKQQNLFQTSVSQYMAAGDSYDEAFYKTKRQIALPSESEHQTGLMIDIIKRGLPKADEKSLKKSEAEMQWLKEHCADYGFILRYPEEKTHITGIDYEPYCYRYVGKEAAKVIMDRGITLEEYIDTLKTS